MEESLETTKDEEPRVDSHCNKDGRSNRFPILRVSCLSHHRVVVPAEEATEDGEYNHGEG